MLATFGAATATAAHARDGRRREAVAMLAVTGTAAGLAVGLRSTAVVFVAAVTAVVAVACGRSGPPRRRLVRTGAAAGLVVALALPVGGYWYGRNWVRDGNPVHPFTIEIAGVRVFAGPLPAGSQEWAWHEPEPIRHHPRWAKVFVE